MAIYRSIYTSFWTDNKIEDNFTKEDKYFYIYLLTNPQTNICGCYEISYSQLRHQTGLKQLDIDKAIERLENVHNVIRFCKQTKEILILNWHKYNWSKSERTLVGVENVVKHIKNAEFKQYIYDIVDCIRNNIPLDTNAFPVQASISNVDTSINNEGKEEQLKKDFQIIYDSYPKKVGKTKAFGKYKLWVTTGKVVNGSRRKLTNKQIWNAIQKYKAKMEQEDTELQYYKNFDTFMGDSIIDYVEE